MHFPWDMLRFTGRVPALSGTGARAGDLKGINVKYRYEFTDHLGGIVALSYASVKKSDTMKTGENTFHYESLRGRYVSLMAGPVWQLSERVSLYGMAGMAYTAGLTVFRITGVMK